MMENDELRNETNTYTETADGLENENKEINENIEINEKNDKNDKKGFFKELLLDILILAVCVLVIPRFVIQRTIVSGSSMESTLHDKDNLLVEKVSYLVGKPDRFDVVVFYPYGKEVNEYYVKRVIGLPGETIQIIGETIYIDGKILKEDYGKDPITFQGIAGEPLTLGNNQYFLMGDNREISYDSRYEEVGPVEEDLIVGRALVRIWPFDSFGDFEEKK
ncbi:MAG: signal peptidase I [Acetivibrio sp.]